MKFAQLFRLSQWFTGNRVSTRTLRFILLIALGYGIFYLLAGFLLYQTADMSNTQASQMIAKDQADAALKQIEAKVSMLQAMTQRIAIHPTLAQTIRQQDMAGQGAFVASAQGVMPYIVELQVFIQPPQLDMNRFPPVSFGTLKLINAIQADLSPAPEIQKVGHQKLLKIAVPIPAANHPSNLRPLGVLVAVFNFDDLVKTLQPSATASYLKLIQGKQWMVYQAGDSAWRHSRYFGSAQNKTGWRVNAALNPQFEFISNSTDHFWLIMVAGTLCSMLFFIIACVVLVSLAKKDQKPLIKKAEANALMNRMASPPTEPSAQPPFIATKLPPEEIFRAYDIRGIFNETLTLEGVRLIGQALGSEALSQGARLLAVGRDGRLSSDALNHALISGITDTGCSVQDIGMAPTPVLYFAAKHLISHSGVMITGSHNPTNYNGLKMVIKNQSLSGDVIQKLRRRIETGDLQRSPTPGMVMQKEVTAEYMQHILQHIKLLKSLTVVIDAGNGVAGPLAQELLTALGCKVIPLFCDVDGTFPNHHPDPSKLENLQTLITTVKETQADIGLAFDGDGDRLGVVTSTGRMIYPDRLMMLFVQDILSRLPGSEIIFDVKCSRHLPALITQLGGRPLMSKTGHSYIKNELARTKAPLAGEMSGHIFFNDRWFGFDDGLYTAVRLLELLAGTTRSAEAIFAELPESLSTPEINIAVSEQQKFKIIEMLQQQAQFVGGNVITLDGVRVDYSYGWGLIRASNTTPVLVARFEAETQTQLEAIQKTFRDQLLRVAPQLSLPF